jgi:hypothetical protein
MRVPALRFTPGSTMETRSLTFVADMYSAKAEAGVCSACGETFALSTATKNQKIMRSRRLQRQILAHMFDRHNCWQGMKRGRITVSGVKVRQGRPREYERALKSDSARACELGDGERQRCRCRCRGTLHGARRQLEAIKPGDPHYTIIEAYQRAKAALARAAGQNTLLS